MSEMVRYTGKLRLKEKLPNETLEEQCKRILCEHNYFELQGYYDSWKEMYFSLEKLDKKLFWRSIIKEIIVDKNMNIIDVIFL